MRVLLVQLDGKLPNIALMRIAAHHREQGDHVEFRRWVRPEQVAPELGQPFDRVYGSAIFTKTRPLIRELLHQYPGKAFVGGTGSRDERTVESLLGWTTLRQDYSIYPSFRPSIGFTQRGCRLKCSFCVVPKKEGPVAFASTIADIYRGEPHPRELILLDNDFFGEPEWPWRIREIREGRFKVCFSQGINARALGDDEAAALASVDYRDDSMRVRRIYTAWDNRKDEARLFRGLDLLVKHGVKPDHIMVYILVGYWPNETAEDREHRRARLREFGARPYPMPFLRTPELVGFQRFVIGAYDKRFTWDEWQHAGYRPEKLGKAA